MLIILSLSLCLSSTDDDQRDVASRDKDDRQINWTKGRLIIIPRLIISQMHHCVQMAHTGSDGCGVPQLSLVKNDHTPAISV